MGGALNCFGWNDDVIDFSFIIIESISLVPSLIFWKLQSEIRPVRSAERRSRATPN